jgi:hypothetical protein
MEEEEKEDTVAVRSLEQVDNDDIVANLFCHKIKMQQAVTFT